MESKVCYRLSYTEKQELVFLKDEKKEAGVGRLDDKDEARLTSLSLIENLSNLENAINANYYDSDIDPTKKIILETLKDDFESSSKSIKNYIENYKKADPKTRNYQEEFKDFNNTINKLHEASLMVYRRRFAEILLIFPTDEKEMNDSKIFLEQSDKRLKDKKILSPKFSQANAESKFSPTGNVNTSSEKVLGKNVCEVGDEIKNSGNPRDTLLSRNMINVNIFPYDNTWVSRSNRSLAAAYHSGIEPRITIQPPEKYFINLYNKEQKSKKTNEITLESKDDLESNITVKEENFKSIKEVYKDNLLKDSLEKESTSSLNVRT